MSYPTEHDWTNHELQCTFQQNRKSATELMNRFAKAYPDHEFRVVKVEGEKGGRPTWFRIDWRKKRSDLHNTMMGIWKGG